MPGYYVENFGCRATQADGAALERQFEERGVERAGSAALASVVVLNTCTVTAAADRDARAAIRRVRRQNPEASIVVTGCYAQRAPEELAAIPGVSLVVGNSHKHQLAEIAVPRTMAGHSSDVWQGEQRVRRYATGTAEAAVPTLALPTLALPTLALPTLAVPTLGNPSGFVSLAALTERPVFVSDIFAHTELLAAPVFDAANERTRPNLKIQDGCDNRCSFCVIPYVRGQSRSLERSRIVAEVTALVEAGYREVVISGINLGRWGRDLGPSTLDFGPQTSDSGARDHRATTHDLRLASLIRVILAETALEKLRISSVEPMDWSDELIGLVATSPRIAKHAHVPMQSGSDAVLRRMHRKYRPWQYREKIETIRAAMPEAAIGADVMVGFPGETDAEFEETRRMVEDLPFTYLHVFTYSARPGTPAAEMRGQVPVQIARERNRVLREMAAQKKLAFMRGFVGGTVQAISLHVTGHDSAGGFTEALTDNYLKMRVRGQHEANRWMLARVENVVEGSLVGGRVEA